jgi:DNA/RNA endonuclease YhcR with UshA esterase domain
MKLLVIFAVVLTLTAAAFQSRADDTNAVAAKIGSAEASKWIGKQVIVTGVVAQVSVRPSLIFLNFDKAYPSNLFTAIVRNKNTNEFESLSALRGKAVSVKGKITDYNGKLEMELTRKAQLKILSETK